MRRAADPPSLLSAGSSCHLLSLVLLGSFLPSLRSDSRASCFTKESLSFYTKIIISREMGGSCSFDSIAHQNSLVSSPQDLGFTH